MNMKENDIIYSEIFEQKHTVGFHREMINFGKLTTYRTLCITSVNDEHLLVRKTGYVKAVLAGGGSEERNACFGMIRVALLNAGCRKDLVPELISELHAMRLSNVHLNNVRENLEESGIYAPKSKYFGHSKTQFWYDVIVFEAVDPQYFNKYGELTPLESLEDVSKVRTFKPLDKSLKKKNPHLVLSTEACIKGLQSLHPDQRVIFANYLLEFCEKYGVCLQYLPIIEFCIQEDLEYAS
jgi:hypothetical protein